jgi:hypothetical protein
MTKKRALVAIPLVGLSGVAVVLALATIGNRISTSDEMADSGGSISKPAPEPGADSADSGARALDASSTRQAVSPVERAVISTGQVTLHAKDMGRARSEVIRLVTSWGGAVADEQSSSDDHGRLSESTLTLRIPSDHFDDAMAAFGELGEVEQRSQKSEDVTTKVIDTDARVRAAERSIRQIEALLSRAQKLGDVIAIENDLARRQADLDSLKSQQAWLRDQTSLSTITVYLSRPMAHPAPPVEAKGFLAGLERGWEALQGTTVVALTVVGAVLPFAVLVALVGVPLGMVVRRRRLPAPPPAEA